MDKIVHIYCGDNAFKKLSGLETYSNFKAWTKFDGKKLFDFNLSQECLVSTVNLGWSFVIFKYETNVYYSGFIQSGIKKEIFHNFKEDISTISCGLDFTMLNLKNGDCYFFCNKILEPQLINFKEKIKIKSVVTEDMHNLALSEDGKIFKIEFGDNIRIDSVDVTKPIKEVACGKEHVLLLSTDGSIFSYGLGSRGQLGHGTIENQNKPMIIDALDGLEIIKIAAGGWHSAAVSYVGDLYMWGWNESGQLGMPCLELHEDISPMSEIETVCCLPKIVEFGYDVKVISVSCGSRHTAAITDDNHVWTWGWNGYGQLGQNRNLTDKPENFLLPDYFIPINVKCKFWSTLITGRIN